VIHGVEENTEHTLSIHWPIRQRCTG